MSTSTGGEVAVKLLRDKNDELRKRMLLEARLCRRLRHRNLISVHDVGETQDGDPFIVMELLTGEALEDLLARTPKLPTEQAAAIGRDVAI